VNITTPDDLGDLYTNEVGAGLAQVAEDIANPDDPLQMAAAQMVDYCGAIVTAYTYDEARNIFLDLLVAAEEGDDE
jgi:hypothetical protein